MTLWHRNVLFFVLNHRFPTEKHFTLPQPVDQDRYSHGATVCVQAVQTYYNIGSIILGLPLWTDSISKVRRK